MTCCRHLTLKSDEDDPNPEDPEIYWWCSKHGHHASVRDCTIIPCQRRAINGCEDADFTDYFKKYGYTMTPPKPITLEAEG